MPQDAGAVAPPRGAERARKEAALDFSPFSRPDEGSRALADAVVAAYAPAILMRGLEACAEAGAELAAFLAAAAARIEGLELGWADGFGVIHQALEDGASPLEGLVETALHLSASGLAGRWRADLATPRPWLFGDQRLAPATRLDVEVDGGRARLRLDASVVELERSGSGWRASDLTAESALPRLSTAAGAAWAVLCSGQGLFAFDPRHLAMLPPHPIDPAFGEVCEAAMRQLAVAAPPYETWVTDVVRTVAPCRAKPDTLSSGSSARMPGVVRITQDGRPEAVLEMLVHEATHQYFYLGGLVGEVSDPTDRRLFYSPVKETGRTIDRILLAYHAFANVEAAFAGCVAARVGDGGYYGPQFEKLVPQLDLMEGHLLSAGSLTPLGWDLARPLIERRGRT